MAAPKKAGFPSIPFLKVPTLIATNTLRPSGRLALISAQARRSCPGLSGATIRSPHSASCQITPASGPMIPLNQLAKGLPVNFASRSEADIFCTEDNACFSNESICGAPVIPTDKTFATTNSFNFVMALKVELHPELNDAWLISRGEAGKLARRFPRTAFDADIRNPQLIEVERAAGHVIHSLEVGPVEEIESVEDKFELERVVVVEADSPSHSQISREESRPDAGVASHRKRAVVAVAVEVDVNPSHDVEGKTAARGDDRRQVKIGERPLVPRTGAAVLVRALEDRRER